MQTKSWLPKTLMLVVMAAACGAWAAPGRAQTPDAQEPYPVIYSTDLYYTFIMDNDDPFDAAVLLTTPQLDAKEVILDNHTYPTDGQKVMAKLMEYSDRHVPVVPGLGQFSLRSPEDQGLNAADQGGVEMLLKILRESPRKVDLIAVGSMTDFAAAFNRDPELLREKVQAVYVVAGTMESRQQDWNVKLDPTAFVRIMRSGLPIVWVPVDTSMWYFPAPQMLVPTRTRLAHFLLNESLYFWLTTGDYMMKDAPGEPPKDRYLYYELGLRLWSTPVFVLASHDPDASKMVTLTKVRVSFDDQGMVTSLQEGVKDSNITAVKSVNGELLNQFIVAHINR
jgi:Inosine-uridine preferring nucleoside hydrolase